MEIDELSFASVKMRRLRTCYLTRWWVMYDLELGEGSTMREKGERLCSLASAAVGEAEIVQVDSIEEQEQSQGQGSGIRSVKQGWKKRSQKGARGGLAEHRKSTRRGESGGH